MQWQLAWPWEVVLAAFAVLAVAAALVMSAVARPGTCQRWHILVDHAACTRGELRMRDPDAVLHDRRWLISHRLQLEF